MKVDEKIKQHFENLISQGNSLINSATSPQQASWLCVVDPETGAEWTTRALSFIERILGEASSYAISYKESIGDYSDGSKMKRSLGILKAAYQDYLADALFNVLSAPCGISFCIG